MLAVNLAPLKGEEGSHSSLSLLSCSRGLASLHVLSCHPSDLPIAVNDASYFGLIACPVRADSGAIVSADRWLLSSILLFWRDCLGLCLLVCLRLFEGNCSVASRD